MNIQRKIYIFNPKDIPFGPLSNIYPLDKFDVNGQKFVNITNFVYNFFGCSATDRTILANMKKQNEIYNTALTMNSECFRNIGFDSLKEAYTERFKSQIFAKALLSTGNKQLIYNSGDEFEGIGTDGKGLNKVGQFLMTLRAELLSKKYKQIEKESKIEKYVNDYEAYVTFNYLVRQILRGKDFLKEFIGLSVPEIIEKVGRSDVFRDSLSLDSFIDSMRRRNPEYTNKPQSKVDEWIYIRPEISEFVQKHPKRLAEYARKSYIEEAIQAILYNNLYDLVEIYIQEKDIYKGRGISSSEAMKIIRSDREKFGVLVDRIEALYRENKMDERVIQAFNTKYNIPSRQEVEEASNVIFVEEVPEALVEDIEEVVVPEIVENIVNISEEVQALPANVNRILFGDRNDPVTGFLCPDFLKLLNINGLYFPSPLHFKYASLISIALSYEVENIKISNEEYKKFMNKAHPYIMTKPFESQIDINNYILDSRILDEIQREVQAKRLIRNINERLEKSYNIKFGNNPELKQLLVNTGDAQIIYNDYNDLLLGQGPEGGQNLSGKMLMKFRERYIAEGMVIQAIEDKSVKLIDLVQGNVEFVRWILMRTNEVIESISTTVDYLNSNVNVDKSIKLTPEFLEFIINKIYKNCAEIILNENMITNVPIEFYRMVQKSLSKYYIGPKGITVLWQYIYSLISQSIKYLGNGDVDETIRILKDLPSSQMDMVKCDGPHDNSVQNCTLIVIRNLVKVMSDYIFNKYKNYVISDNDINYVIRMLVNVEIPSNTSLEGQISLDLKPSKFSPQDEVKIQKIIKKLPKYLDIPSEKLDLQKISKQTIKVGEELNKLVNDSYLEDLIKEFEKEFKEGNFTEEYLLGLQDYVQNFLNYQEDKDYIRSLRIRYIINYFKEFFETSYLSIDERNVILRKILWFLNYIKGYTNESDENKAKVMSRINLFLEPSQLS